MVALKAFKKFILMIILMSIVMSFCAIPASYAKLDLKDGEFYYAGTQKGQYVAKSNVFEWVLDLIGDIADWLVGIMTMGIRAVFIGWTALFERLLTGALEATAGVNMDGEVSNTDITSVITSENNVTVQAIVYNHVPALDANFFNTKYNTSFSPTGHELRCKKCKELCEKCCSIDEATGEATCNGGCTCKGNCRMCKTYRSLKKSAAATNTADKPIIIQLKEQIALWYMVFRFIALAAMLAVLVFVGIKIAISTIASDKAFYKRMLVDWFVGILIIFALHYGMYFTFMVNESLVTAIENAGKNITAVELKKELPEGENAKINNEELEVDIYEEVRSRAYDAKLLNGTIGMIMYMALVYMAIRYTLIYIKRFFTIAMLGIMGPGIGVAYALQKVLSGKSSALTQWLSEFIMNVIIQTVHALIYTVFISAALVLSLKSISGTIVALIIMNFALKAEPVFRKIFKMDSSKLLRDTENAGDLQAKYASIVGAYKGAGATAKMLTNTPYAKALKFAGKTGVAAGVIAASAASKAGKDTSDAIKDATKDYFESKKKTESEDNEEDIEKEMNESQGGYEQKEGETNADYQLRRTLAAKNIKNRRQKEKAVNPKARDEYVSGKTMEELEEVFEKAKKEYEVDPDNIDKENDLIDAYNDLQRKQVLESGVVTTADVVKGHLDRVFNINNYFETKTNSKGVTYVAPKLRAIYGTKHIDPVTGDRVSDNNSILDQFRASNLLGFTKEDAKVFKENVTKPLKNGLVGTAATFVGLATFVMHPKLGMGLLAYGVPSSFEAHRKLGYLPNSKLKYKNKKYKFKAFSLPAIKNMRSSIIDRARRERDASVVNNVKLNHPNLYFGIKAGTVTAATIFGGALAGAGVFAIQRFIEKFAEKKRREKAYKDEEGRLRVEDIEDYEEYAEENVSPAMYAVNMHHYKQLKAQQKEFVEDSARVMAVEYAVSMENAANDYLAKETVAMYAEMGFKFDEKTGELTRLDKDEIGKDKKAKDTSQDSLNNEGSNDSNSDDTDEERELIRIDIKEKKDAEIKPEELIEEIDGTKPSDKDLAMIDESIDKILTRIANQETIDINSEEKLDTVIKNLGSKLYSSGLISRKQKVEDVFKGGRKGLVGIIKRKTTRVNKKIESANTAFDKCSNKEADAIKDSIQETIAEMYKTDSKDNAEKEVDYKKVDPKAVLEKVKSKLGTEIIDTEDSDSENMNSGIDTQSVETAGQVEEASVEKTNKYMNAITSYLDTMDSISNPDRSEKKNKPKVKPVSNSEKAEARRIVNKKIKDRKTKLQQVLDVSLDSFDDGIDMLEKDDDLAKSSQVLEMLLIAKEASDLNKIVVEDYKIKKGEKAYAKALKLEAEVGQDYYKDKLEVEKFKRDYSSIYNSNPDSLSPEERFKLNKIKKIEKGLKEKEEKLKKVEKERKNAGPIVDVNSLVNLNKYM